MHDRILAEIERIEREHEVRVIYACESGSRAWGFPSRDSDYDVRMVYFNPIDFYLSLRSTRDVIEIPITDALDINGWDLRKTLALLRKSNPNILEWSRSPIIYRREESFSKIEQLLEMAFRPDKAMRHYLNMALNTKSSFLERESINVKKYLYTIRPLLCARWISQNLSQPPILYSELVEAMLTDEPKVASEIHTLVERKRDLNESNDIARNDILHKWIAAEFDRLEEAIPESSELPDWEPFQQTFYEVIGY